MIRAISSGETGNKSTHSEMSSITGREKHDVNVKDAPHPYYNSTNTPRGFVQSVSAWSGGSRAYSVSGLVCMRGQRSYDLGIQDQEYPPPPLVPCTHGPAKHARAAGQGRAYMGCSSGRVPRKTTVSLHRLSGSRKVPGCGTSRDKKQRSARNLGVPAPIVPSIEPRPCQYTTQHTLSSVCVAVARNTMSFCPFLRRVRDLCASNNAQSALSRGKRVRGRRFDRRLPTIRMWRYWTQMTWCQASLTH